MPSTLSDANARRSEKFFEEIYRELYEANKDILSSDSRRNGTDSTTPIIILLRRLHATNATFKHKNKYFLRHLRPCFKCLYLFKNY